MTSALSYAAQLTSPLVQTRRNCRARSACPPRSSLSAAAAALSMNGLFGRKPSPAGNSNAASAGAAASAAAASPAVAASSLYGPPSQLTSNATYNEAIAQLNVASQREDAGDLRAAQQQYENGLQMLMGLLKQTPQTPANESTRNWLRILLSSQMTKAEQLATRLGGGSAGGSSHSASARSAPVPLQRSQSGPHQHASSSGSMLRSGSSSASPLAASSPPRTENVDPALRAAIEGEILRPSSHISFASVLGLDDAKAALREMVILPSLRPDLFTGVRAPPRGLLLYGPPVSAACMLAAVRRSSALKRAILCASLVRCQKHACVCSYVASLPFSLS